MEKMTWRDVLDLVYEYEDNVRDHPAHREIKYGCDCGCGGDAYSDEDWEAFDEAMSQTMMKVLDFCAANDIEYTGGYS